MIKLRESIWILLFVSTPVFATTAINKKVDNLTNSSGGSSLSVPSTGSNLVSDTNSISLTNKTINGSLNTLSNVPAGSLTGTTLASNVVTSSLTTVGTIGSGTWQATIIGTTFGGTGVNSSATFPTSGTILTNSNTVTVSNKTLSGSNNTFSQLPIGGQTIQALITPYPDGSTTSFTLSISPPANAAVSLYLDGCLLMQGSGLDYTISGSTITMSVAPALGQKLYAVYSQY